MKEKSLEYGWQYWCTVVGFFLVGGFLLFGGKIVLDNNNNLTKCHETLGKIDTLNS